MTKAEEHYTLEVVTHEKFRGERAESVKKTRPEPDPNTFDTTFRFRVGPGITFDTTFGFRVGSGFKEFSR